jgi:hypothetical protein
MTNRKIMSQRKMKAPTHAGTGYTCGQCARGAYNMENRDYTGAPFLIYCEHGTQGYSKRVRQWVTYKDCDACEHYQKGQREGGIS